ncbi:MAG: DNA-binding protein [candidate division Zixibacteria bacterium]|nr:DNA-binding protein [candidate division Zixibacteria bacterium]
MLFQKIKDGYVIRLEKGEEIINSLTDFADKYKIEGGFIYGIGTVNNLTLGYYEAEKKNYLKKSFPDDFELVSLMGNISLLKGNPMVHVHVVISDVNFNTLAGHLFSGTVSVTGEFVILATKDAIERAFDKETGLNLLQL